MEVHPTPLSGCSLCFLRARLLSGRVDSHANFRSEPRSQLLLVVMGYGSTFFVKSCTMGAPMLLLNVLGAATRVRADAVSQDGRISGIPE